MAQSLSQPDRRRTGAQLLDMLPTALVPSLLEFAEYVASLDVDYVIFMARKAARLHDLLIAAGCRLPRGIMVTDHVLDQSLNMLRGKRCALVDDTMILGTTLADAETKLRVAGVDEIVKVVFAVDEDNWSSEICEVDRYFVRLDQKAMLNFCAAEVEALALAGIPYLTDFPVSSRIRVSRSQLSVLYSLPGWDSYALTTELQEEARVYYYTHLPTATNLGQMSATIGELWRIVEIAKVRSFIFTTDTAHLGRVIPIITLKPLTHARIGQLFVALLGELDTLGADQRDRLATCLTSPRAQLRFLQYFLGLIVGEQFLTGLVGALGYERESGFDAGEATRLFGPWLRPEIDAVHFAAAAIALGSASPKIARVATTPASLPHEVKQFERIDLDTLFHDRHGIDATLDEPRNLFSDLLRVFVELHTQYEIPAREEVRRLGRRIGEADPRESPRRDRLKMGITWSTLSEFLARRARLPLRKLRSMQMSLMLDALIDIGIAVPIIAERDGVLFRAYRHGEDALFAEQENALAYQIAKGFLEGASRDDIPRLTMEKLLVALMRVGVSRKFLAPHFGTNGSQRVARIAFHRHGAVATIADEPAVFADSQDSWLSRHLVNVGVMKREGEHYTLGTEPDAGLIASSAIQEAHQLGWMLGTLNAARDGGATLSQNDLTLLTTCPQARDAAGAVLAEYRIFDRWFVSRSPHLGRLDFSSERACEKALTDLAQSGGYAAFNSARFKLSGYLRHRPSEIVEKCAAALRSGGGMGSFVATSWLGIWQPIVGAEHERQRVAFEEQLGRLANAMLTIAVGMFTMELAIASALLARNRMMPKRYGEICAKVVGYLEAMEEFLPARRDLSFSRLKARAVAGEPMPDPARAYEYGLSILARNEHGARTVAAKVAEDVRKYARIAPSVSFRYALWFDVIDAMGRRQGLEGAPLNAYRARVSHFLTRVNQTITGIMRDARRDRGKVTVVPSNLESKDDEKHILFAGTRSHARMKQVAVEVLAIARAEGVAVRMLLINADFAGTSPYEYHGEPAIQGQDFWEFGRGVRSHLRSLEGELTGGGKTADSLLWLGDQLSGAAEEMGLFNPTSQLTNAVAKVSIDERPLRVALTGGYASMANIEQPGS